MTESPTTGLEESSPLFPVQKFRLEIIPLPEQVAKKFAYDHRHESFTEVAFVLGITPRALQHRYQKWRFNPKTPCEEHVTARQYARFYKTPYPTISDRLVHRTMEGRKHGLIWEIPVSMEEREAILENEKNYKKDIRKKDRRRKRRRVRKTERTLWPDEAKKILLDHGELETPSQLRERLKGIGEDRTEGAIGRQYALLKSDGKSKDHNVPRKHKKKFTQEEELEVLVSAGNVSTSSLAESLERKPESIQGLYHKLGINLFDYDKRMSVRQLAGLTGIPATTLYDQIRKGKLTGLEMVRVGRHIRVVWQGNEDELRPQWNGSRLLSTDPIIQAQRIRENCLTCNRMLITPSSHGRNLYCSGKCKGSYHHWLFEEKRDGVPMVDRPFPAHLRFAAQDWLAEGLGVFQRQQVPEKINEVFDIEQLREGNFVRHLAERLHHFRGYYLPWQYLVEGSTSRATTKDTLGFSIGNLRNVTQGSWIIDSFGSYGWGLGVRSVAQDMEVRTLHFLGQDLNRTVQYGDLHRDVYQTLDAPDNFSTVAQLVKKVGGRIQSPNHRLRIRSSSAMLYSLLA